MTHVRRSHICNYSISQEVFIHIHQGCFAGTGAIIRLPQCQWSKPDGYGKISLCITTTKHSKAKTVCIFLGIYCTAISSREHWINEDWKEIVAIFIHLLIVSKCPFPPTHTHTHFFPVPISSCLTLCIDLYKWMYAIRMYTYVFCKSIRILYSLSPKRTRNVQAGAPSESFGQEEYC